MNKLADEIEIGIQELERVYNTIQAKIQEYQKAIEYCEENKLYGKMLHYPEILKELKSIMRGKPNE